MKNLFFTLSLFFLSFSGQSQSLKTIPEYPIPGEQITFQFDPDSTLFQKADIVELLIYLNDHSSEPAVVVLEKNEDSFTGIYHAPEDAKAILVYPFNRKLNLPNNSEKIRFRYFFYEEDRETPRKEVYFSMYKLLQQYNRLDFKSKTHPEDFLLLKKELDTNPDIISNTDFLLLYFTGGILLEDKFILKKAEKWFNNFFKNQKTASEKEFFIAQNIATHKHDYKTERLVIKRGAEKFPKLEAQRLFNKFKKVIFIHEKTNFFRKIKKVEGDNPILTNTCAAGLVKSYMEAGNLKKVEKYIVEIKEPKLRAATMNEIVKTYMLFKLDNKDFAILKSLSALSLKIITSEINNHQKEPKEYVFGDVKKRLTRTLARYTDSFAYLEFKSENYQNALMLQEKACEEMNFENNKMNENYCLFLLAAGKTEVAKKKLEEFIPSHFTHKMEEMLSLIFTSEGKTEEEFDAYLNKLRFGEQEKFKEALKTKVLSSPATDFKLKKLKGKSVALKNLKGKIVVLTFWNINVRNTMNFLLEMGKIQEKFKTDTEIEFLSIKVANPIESPIYDVATYLNVHELKQSVLLDSKKKVFEMYQTPLFSNVIIDKEGIIRFKSSEFNGDRRYLNYELSNMIELVKE